MSGIIKAVKKVFKSPVFKAIVIAAAIWFTAGVATAYMAAPSAGLGGAMSASWTSMSMTATTGSFVSASEVAVSNAVALQNGVTVAAVATEGATTATAISATEGAGALTTAEAAGGTIGGEIAGEAALMEASVAGTMPAATSGAATTTGSTVAAGGAGGGSGIVGGAGSWAANNPVATMMLGQGAFGAYGSYEARKQAEDDRAEAQRVREDRGLMGVEYDGTPAPSGLVASQQVAPPQTVAQATAAPTVAAPTVAPAPRPVDRNNLPQLQKQGLVAPPQVG